MKIFHPMIIDDDQTGLASTLVRSLVHMPGRPRYIANPSRQFSRDMTLTGNYRMVCLHNVDAIARRYPHN